eukprot:gene10705-10862_t
MLPTSLQKRHFLRLTPPSSAAAADVTVAPQGVGQAGGAAGAAPAKLSGADIRERFLSFFEGKGHSRLLSSSLVPEDPTVLLTIAGMLQFKPVFLGQAARKVPRATTTQKCVRTNDIENVGVTARHHTFFEMLGNFSFGDYFKKEAICWAWELSTQVFGLAPERVWVSVYEEDEEALGIWRDVVGVDPNRIRKMGAADNFWASGPTGPCGPCSELYFDFHPERGNGPEVSLEDDSRFIEFYNLVFMELNRDSAGQLTPLAAKNIDTGMGLERMAQILQAADLAGLDYHSASPAAQTALKVIGDHIRAVVYLMSDGVVPSNVGRGYVVRRLLRRVVMKGRLLGIKDLFTAQVAAVAIALSGPCDPLVAANAARITAEMTREEAAFAATLSKGQKLLDEMLAKALAAPGNGSSRSQPVLAGAEAFLLYDSFGFPLELTQELAEAQGVVLDVEGFEAAMAAQRARSSSSREAIDLTAAGGGVGQLAQQLSHDTEFVGYDESSLQLDGCRVVGLLVKGQPVPEVEAAGKLAVGHQLTARVDRTLRRRIRAHHTATHLLQSALKLVLGPDTCQQGSTVDSSRLRFDFNLSRPMTATELAQVERLVNSWVADASPTTTQVMDLAEARAAGATAMFGEKYDDVVRVVAVPGVSMELCGGTHVSNTAEIGAFKVVSEGGVASGVRRIEAVAGQAAVEYLQSVDGVVRALAGNLKVKGEDVPARVAALQALASRVQPGPSGVGSLLVEQLPGLDAKALQEAALSLLSQLPEPAAVLLASSDEADASGKVSFVAALSPQVVKGGLQAGKVVGAVAKVCGGGGGGKPVLAQADGKDSSKLPEALRLAKELMGAGLQQ